MPLGPASTSRSAGGERVFTSEMLVAGPVAGAAPLPFSAPRPAPPRIYFAAASHMPARTLPANRAAAAS